MGILAILGIIILTILAFIGGSALGWFLKGVGKIFSFMWEGCATTLGVIWAIIFYIFLFCLLLAAL